jgi:hypothetical protein
VLISLFVGWGGRRHGTERPTSCRRSTSRSLLGFEVDPASRHGAEGRKQAVIFGYCGRQ